MQSYRLHLFPLRNQTGQLSVLIPSDNHNLSCLLLPPFSQSQLLLPLSHTYTDFLLSPSLELGLTSGMFLLLLPLVLFLPGFYYFFLGLAALWSVLSPPRNSCLSILLPAVNPYIFLALPFCQGGKQAEGLGPPNSYRLVLRDEKREKTNSPGESQSSWRVLEALSSRGREEAARVRC